MKEVIQKKSYNVGIKDLFNVGAHLGHKASNWNPAMSTYIYGEKAGMQIIDLRKTYGLLISTLDILFQCAKNKGKILFVGTRTEIRDMVSEYASYCGQFYVNHRWLGGMITNWSVVSKSIRKLDNMDRLMQSDNFASYTKKERLSFEKSSDKLSSYLGGIRKMNGLPNLVIVLDQKKDRIAISEANKAKIPVISLLDTDSDPSGVDHPIPSNDDASKCIKLYLQLFSSSILAGMEASISKDKKKDKTFKV